MLALTILLFCVGVTACASANEPSPPAASTIQAPGLDAGSVCGGSFETALPRNQQELEQLPLVDLWFEDAVPQKDRQDIKAGLAHVQSYFSSHFTAPPPVFTCFDVRAAAAGPVGSGRASAGRVLILTAPEGWPDESEWGLASVAAHEYVHVWQLMLAGEDAFGRSAVWLIEGMAQWIAFQALLDVRLLPAEYFVCLLEIPPGALTPRLEMLETPAGWRTSLLNYLTSLQAMSQLIDRGETLMLQRYLVNLGGGALWVDAFSGAFGLSVTDFYRQFAGADPLLGKRPRDLSFAPQRWQVLSASQLGSRLELFRLKVQTQLLEPNGWKRCS